jgi:hypothetical protein
LRSLHLLGSLLEMGCTLDRSLDLVSRLAETRRLRAAWTTVRERMCEGESLSEIARRWRWLFPSATAELLGLGEEQGDLPRALLVAAGAERADLFRAPRDLPDPGWSWSRDPLLKGPVVRIAESLVRQALARENITRIGLFLGEQAALPHALPEPAESGDCLTEQATLEHEQTHSWHGIVAYDRGGTWVQPLTLPFHIFPPLVRHYLYRAGIPYWSRDARSGPCHLQLDGRAADFPLLFEPSPQRLSLTLELRPAGRPA